MNKDFNKESNQEESFEMIELAIEDMDALAQVFGMIDALCDEINSELSLEEIPSAGESQDIVWN